MKYADKWEEELNQLKSILRGTGLTETIKWGMEVYTHKGKNIVAAVGLKKNKLLKVAFGAFRPSKQKEFIEHINSAKREDTKKERLEKMIPMIIAGMGLNDKYK
jgi:uncharacterized protein YdeI (YjbR/CyaY-like superfamily)